MLFGTTAREALTTAADSCWPGSIRRVAFCRGSGRAFWTTGAVTVFLLLELVARSGREDFFCVEAGPFEGLHRLVAALSLFLIGLLYEG